mgnify:CR=1 FL=1
MGERGKANAMTLYVLSILTGIVLALILNRWGPSYQACKRATPDASRWWWILWVLAIVGICLWANL